MSFLDKMTVLGDACPSCYKQHWIYIPPQEPECVGCGLIFPDALSFIVSIKED